MLGIGYAEIFASFVKALEVGRRCYILGAENRVLNAVDMHLSIIYTLSMLCILRQRNHTILRLISSSN